MTEIKLYKQGNVQFVFGNGLKVSAYVGYGSYSDSTARKMWESSGYDLRFNKYAYDKNGGITSPTVEYAVIRECDEAWLTHHFSGDNYDDVVGYKQVDEFLDVVARVRTMTKEEVDALEPREKDY